jgi:hypothetical protein
LPPGKEGGGDADLRPLPHASISGLVGVDFEDMDEKYARTFPTAPPTRYVTKLVSSCRASSSRYG